MSYTTFKEKVTAYARTAQIELDTIRFERDGYKYIAKIDGFKIHGSGLSTTLSVERYNPNIRNPMYNRQVMVVHA